MLEHLGVGPGEQIRADKLPDGRIEVRAARAGDISGVFGLLRKQSRAALSLDQMEGISRQGWSGRAGGKSRKRK